MGLPIVNKFCFCCSLETGGIIVGIVNACFGFLGVLGGISFIFVGSAMITFSQSMDVFWWGVGTLIIGSIFIIFYLIYFIAGILLISAVNKREHEKMRLIMILMVIGVIVSFISIIGSILGGLIGAILYAIVTCYLFICIYSLYVKLKEENQGGVHFQPKPFV